MNISTKYGIGDVVEVSDVYFEESYLGVVKSLCIRNSDIMEEDGTSIIKVIYTVDVNRTENIKAVENLDLAQREAAAKQADFGGYTITRKFGNINDDYEE